MRGLGCYTRDLAFLQSTPDTMEEILSNHNSVRSLENLLYENLDPDKKVEDGLEYSGHLHQCYRHACVEIQ